MSESDLENALEHHDETFFADLEALLAQPSISATGEGIPECSLMVRDLCIEYGCDEAEIVETAGQPAIVAHARADRDSKIDGNTSNGESCPTVLLYGHYDVQPATAAEWTSPPFEPTVRDGPDGKQRLYARGAGDNKGQWFAHLCAIRALRETTGLPADVVLLIEGEEESGSENLEWLVREHSDEFDSDVAIVADGPIDSSGRPHVLLGARGLLYVDIEAQGANRDLHSGNFGGPVPNPATAIASLLASLTDEYGRSTLDGFYDDVRPLTERDWDVLGAIPVDEEDILSDLGLDALATNPGEGYVERLLTRPNLNVAGLDAGYRGEGMKTVLPDQARAKIDYRLVADQDPAAVYDALERHVREHTPAGIDVELSRTAAMAPQRTSADSPVVEPAMRAVRDGWDTEPILKPALGGSVPTYVFADALDVPCLVIPYANEDENNHAPDENIKLSCVRAGARTTVALLSELADANLELVSTNS
ncbi:succinyl-diaminopimelate desuccinylase [Halalkalicoccus paucihalophilus]|uniref:Succinyl-diaminopimelate desuccinylase n=1 Tax=Halalkalicoccus paucihalophilus TaxID=1008153 RepID=A0A151ABI3_9EURY|nr:M20/M25/M40 family metallo-hydrolase [Halalkalicoccus paucihalophilus]KYH24995.1 succinyl-diaminopimelate desuccinylase [Halalkalicoccus paucihalophilus]